MVRIKRIDECIGALETEKKVPPTGFAPR